MRLVLVSLLLATSCKAGEVTDQAAPNAMSKPVESQADDRAPLPGEGAASPTSAVEDTPAPAKTEEVDTWSETSTDPWAPTSTPEGVTATPALPDPSEADPWTTTSTDPWAPAVDKTTKREKQPLR